MSAISSGSESSSRSISKMDSSGGIILAFLASTSGAIVGSVATLVLITLLR
jgi:hypothetical protein